MKTLMTLLSAIILTGCCNHDYSSKHCPTDTPEMPGIYSKPLGMVKIDGEDCQLFETYEKYDCKADDEYWDYNMNCVHKCILKVLTRVTKCPSNTTVNEVHREKVGKSGSREIVQ